MKFTSVLSVLSIAAAVASPIDENHLNLALNLAEEQGSSIATRDLVEDDVDVHKRGFLLLAKLKYLWAMKMKSYNVCYQCGGNICGSNCCSCGSPCEYQCSSC